MKKGKARKVLSVLDGMSPDQQRAWLFEKNFASADSEAAYKSAYEQIVEAADL